MPSPNTITGGAFQDSEGNALAAGTLVLELNHDAYTDTTYSTLVCAGQAIELPLNSSGSVVGTPTMWANDVLLDVWTLAATTFYMAKAYSADGQLAWGPNVLRILSTPSPFVITSVAPINPA